MGDRSPPSSAGNPADSSRGKVGMSSGVTDLSRVNIYKATLRFPAGKQGGEGKEARRGG